MSARREDGPPSASFAAFAQLKFWPRQAVGRHRALADAPFGSRLHPDRAGVGRAQHRCDGKKRNASAAVARRCDIPPQFRGEM